MFIDREAIAQLEHLIRHSSGIEREEAEEDLRAIRAKIALIEARSYRKVTGRNEIRSR